MILLNRIWNFLSQSQWNRNQRVKFFKGRGGGQVVSVLAFSNDQSSNPADVYCFFCKFVFEKSKNKQKEAGVGTFLKNCKVTVL